MENINVSDNYKKFKYIIGFLSKSANTRYSINYKDTLSGQEVMIKTCLLKAYPIFQKNEDCYTLHLCFSKNNKFEHKQIEKYKHDLIRFLKEATKKDFRVTTSFFIPDCEKNIFEEAKERQEIIHRMRLIEQAEEELNKQEELKKKLELENQIQKEFEFLQLKNKEKLLNEGYTNSNSGDNDKQIVDPFGDGFLCRIQKVK